MLGGNSAISSENYRPQALLPQLLEDLPGLGPNVVTQHNATE